MELEWEQEQQSASTAATLAGAFLGAALSERSTLLVVECVHDEDVEEERDGCYLFKELTCLPEEIDREYQAVFKEMEAVCGIEVSVMENLGRFSS